MTFEELSKINVNEHTEDKNGLTYLSWTWAWSEIKKVFPNAKYEIKKFDNNLPYVYDENTGYMVFTEMTINDLTYEMWLPVMDGNNKAMLNRPYKYKVKEYKDGKFTGNYLDKDVAAATMFDINKTIMRCLVKNIAMFGLGIYIYAGDDYPEGYEIPKDEALEKTVTFGKYKGMTLKEVQEKDSKYLYYIMDSEYASEGLKAACSVIAEPIEEPTDEKLNLLNEFERLVIETETDRERLYNHFGVKNNLGLTVDQIKEAIEIMRKKVGSK